MVDITRNPKGYYEMKIDGEFVGNYDSVFEASKDYEEMKKEKENNDSCRYES